MGVVGLFDDGLHLFEGGEAVPLFDVSFDELGLWVFAEAHEVFADEVLFAGIFFCGEASADEGEAEPQEIGGNGVVAVILDDFAHFSGLPHFEDGVAVGVEFSGDAAEGGGFVEADGGAFTGEASGDEVHEINGGVVVASEVVDAFPGFRGAVQEAFGGDAEGDGALGEDAEVGGTGVEPDQLRLCAADGGEEAADDFAFGAADGVFRDFGEPDEAQLGFVAGCFWGDAAHHGDGDDAALHEADEGVRVFLGGAVVGEEFLEEDVRGVGLGVGE